MITIRGIGGIIRVSHGRIGVIRLASVFLDYNIQAGSREHHNLFPFSLHEEMIFEIPVPNISKVSETSGFSWETFMINKCDMERVSIKKINGKTNMESAGEELDSPPYVIKLRPDRIREQSHHNRKDYETF